MTPVPLRAHQDRGFAVELRRNSGETNGPKPGALKDIGILLPVLSVWIRVVFAFTSEGKTSRPARVAYRGGGAYFEKTKTKTSRRSILLPSGMVLQLKEHRATQAELLLKLGIRSDIVFATNLSVADDTVIRIGEGQYRFDVNAIQQWLGNGGSTDIKSTCQDNEAN